MKCVDMTIAIDPGFRTTGWALLRPIADKLLPELVDHGNTPTIEFLERLRSDSELIITEAVIENVGHYGTGMSAGSEVFDTCIFLGQMHEILESVHGAPVKKIRRQTIKTQLCGRATAKKAEVRQAVIDRWGGNERAIGGKKCPQCKGKGWRGRGRSTCAECNGDGWYVPPGPLYGVTGHAWDALAAGIYRWEMKP